VEGCRHCHMAAGDRSKGLCSQCYYDEAIRVQYPSESPYGHRGTGYKVKKGSMPRTATRELPGTPAKIAVLEERAQAGQTLWHPLDAKPLTVEVPMFLTMLRQIS
jgi:hypothetical protein